MSDDASRRSDPERPPEIGGPPAESAGRPLRRRRMPGKWVWGILVVCAVLIGLIWQLGLERGHSRADLNVATLVLSLVAAGTLLVWFVFFSGYSSAARGATAAATLALVVLSAAVFRIEQVTGDLIPQLAFRWRATPDRELQTPSAAGGVVDLGRVTEHDFPEFLGPGRQNRLPGLLLETDWEAHPPRLLWRTEIGAGWSGFSVVNGYAVTMEQRGDDELVTCRDVATGQIRWFHAVPARHESTLGGVGPRSTPTLHEGKVYALGATGVLRCLDGGTGREIWRDDILQRIGLTPQADAREIAWGRAASPLVLGDLLVVPWGGPEGRRASLAAYNRRDGKLVWTGGQHQASYSSPCLATFRDVPQILIVNQHFVSAHDPDSGGLLWEYPWPGDSSSNASVSQPVALPGDRLLLSKGYGVGSRLLQVRRGPQGSWLLELLWASPRALQTKFTNVVVQDGFVYGLSDGILECVDLDTGRRQWKGGRYGQGQVLGVGDCLLVQAETGQVVLVAAAPDGHHEWGSLAALEGKTWNNPCLFGNLLLVRNGQQAACYELTLRK